MIRVEIVSSLISLRIVALDIVFIVSPLEFASVLLVVAFLINRDLAI